MENFYIRSYCGLLEKFVLSPIASHCDVHDIVLFFYIFPSPPSTLTNLSSIARSKHSTISSKALISTRHRERQQINFPFLILKEENFIDFDGCFSAFDNFFSVCCFRHGSRYWKLLVIFFCYCADLP